MGAVVGGSSAGAMVLGEVFFDPYQKQLQPGLGLLTGMCVLPHHAEFGQSWALRLAHQRAGLILVSLDERTGILNDGDGGAWSVYGAGTATIYHQGEVRSYRSGEQFII